MRLRHRAGSGRLSRLMSALAVALGLLGLAGLGAADPPQGSLTLSQREKLQEAKKLQDQARRSQREGKLADAVTAAQRGLALLREVRGDRHADVASALAQLAELHEAREDFAAARHKGRALPFGPLKGKTAQRCLSVDDPVTGRVPGQAP